MRNRRKPFVVEKLEIKDLADQGRGVGKDELGRVFFVEDVAPGDIVDIVAKQQKKGVFNGVVQHVHQYSPHRREPLCSHFWLCGGCKLQHIAYQEQLRQKQSAVENAIKRLGKVEVKESFPIFGCQHEYFYRNKLEFTFANRRWLTKEELDTDISNKEDVLGFHREGAFDKVINIEKCFLQYEPSNFVRNTIKAIAIEQELAFFDPKLKTGYLRQLMFRITTLGDIMVVLSVYEDRPKELKMFLDEIIQRVPAITSLYYCINFKLNNFMFDLDMHLYHGQEYVEDKLGDIQFRIGPKSFFQTNTKQAELLYQTIANFAGLTGTENVYDLYTGIGSIALFIAKYCRQVVGIEEVELAIEDAKENAQRNNIHNSIFYAGDVKDILTPEFAQKHGKPDVLITDPPRAGMHPKVVQMLLELEAPKLVYVSCKPATQARDLHILSEKYDVLKSQPVDMFPHTHHIENVVLLQLKGISG